MAYGEGYVDCACRDCFEIAIGAPGVAMCHGCEDAGCEAGAEQECEAPHSYGGCEDTCPDCGESLAEYGCGQSGHETVVYR